MKEAWNFTRAVQVLSGEIELLRKISAVQSSVRQAVISREWTDFDEKTLEINRLGMEFARLEQDRADLFSGLGYGTASNTGSSVNYGAGDPVKSGEAGVTLSVTPNGINSGETDKKAFSALISGLPEEQRKELSVLYRELKMETHKMKALNETFLAYLNEAKTLAAAYIGAVCPSRSGKLYTRKGRTVSPDLRSIVFNNRF